MLNTAYAYYYQDTQIQYDQAKSRRNLNIAPEFASEYVTAYLDCSTYANAVYYNTFGFNLTSVYTTYYYDEYAKANIGKAKDVIYYIDVKDYPTVEAQKALLAEIYASLQPGDLINYRHGVSSGSSGHVMIYIGNGKILHCTGTSYVYDSDPTKAYDKATSLEAKEGGINLIDASLCFTNTSSSRYLFKKTSSDSVWTFSILRPMNRDDISITDAALDRVTYPYATYEKTCSVPHKNQVRLNEEITYYLTIKNNSTVKYKTMIVSDKLSEYVTLVSGSISNNGSLSGDTINWVVSIEAGQSVTLEYKVKINNDTNNIGKIVNGSNAYAGSIKFNDIEHTITTLKDAYAVLLVDKADEKIGTSYSDSLLLMKDIYNEALSKSFTTYTKTQDALNNLVDKKLKSTSPLYGILVPDLWGGLNTTDAYTSSNTKTRLVISDYLAPGDIILIYNSYNSTYSSVMYISEAKLLGLSSGKASYLTTTASATSKYLEQLIAYNKFAIIRPSIKQ